MHISFSISLSMTPVFVRPACASLCLQELCDGQTHLAAARGVHSSLAQSFERARQQRDYRACAGMQQDVKQVVLVGFSVVV
jgi:hypothetical protein